MSQLSSKHVIGIEHLTVDDIQLILETAKQFKEIINRPIKKVPTLRDITIANLFFEKLHTNTYFFRTRAKKIIGRRY